MRQVLREVLGESCQLGLQADPDLVGGVRLRHGELEVEASAGAALELWWESLEASPRGELEP